MKNRKHTGFTVVETTLVLAISVATLMAFIITISSRVGRERYKDSTNSFVDFLRRMYSETINVENGRSGSIDSQNDYCTFAGEYAASQGQNSKNPESDGYPGRSGCAIYGKLITFGEDYGTTEEDKQMVYAYDLIGRAIDVNHPLKSNGDITRQLADVNADVFTFIKNSDNTCSVLPVGMVEKYDPAWSSSIENTTRGEQFKGAVLITRSPNSGAMHTYVLEGKTLAIQKTISDNQSVSCGDVVSLYKNIDENSKTNINGYLANGDFKIKEADFCIGSGESFMALPIIKRNNVRITADGHNSTAVELVETDLSKEEGGNRC